MKEATKNKAIIDEEAEFVYELRTPVEYDGETVSKLAFEFGKLTGEDALNIEAELQDAGITAIVPAFSSEYLIRMAAKACTNPIGADIFKKMDIRDFNKIKNRARSFLLASE